MKHHELDRELERLHREGKRKEVIALMRKYGLFTDETVVRDYLEGKQ